MKIYLEIKCEFIKLNSINKILHELIKFVHNFLNKYIIITNNNNLEDIFVKKFKLIEKINKFEREDSLREFKEILIII